MCKVIPRAIVREARQRLCKADCHAAHTRHLFGGAIFRELANVVIAEEGFASVAKSVVHVLVTILMDGNSYVIGHPGGNRA